MNENEYFKCPACLNRSAHMIRLSDETVSDGTYENYRAVCTLCGRHSWDMDDELSAIEAFLGVDDCGYYHDEDTVLIDADYLIELLNSGKKITKRMLQLEDLRMKG